MCCYSGLADKIIDAATNVGAQKAINYARGTGIRNRLGLLGVTIDEQKEAQELLFLKNKQTEYLNQCTTGNSIHLVKE